MNSSVLYLYLMHHFSSFFQFGIAKNVSCFVIVIQWFVIQQSKWPGAQNFSQIIQVTLSVSLSISRCYVCAFLLGRKTENWVLAYRLIPFVFIVSALLETPLFVPREKSQTVMGWHWCLCPWTWTIPNVRSRQCLSCFLKFIVLTSLVSVSHVLVYSDTFCTVIVMMLIAISLLL